MSSRMALGVLMLSVGCELVFILDHRLREISTVSVPLKKKLEIIRETIEAVFNDQLLESIFQDQKLYTFDSLRKLVMSIMQAPSLRINAENFEKLFLIICMSIKCQMCRVLTRSDFFLYVENQINDVIMIAQSLTQFEEAIDILENARDMANKYYENISNSEVNRIRYSILNLFRHTQSPVYVLIEDGYQSADGIILAPTTGPKLQDLGYAVIFKEDGSKELETDLSIAGKMLEERVMELGRNRFSREAVSSRLAQQDLMKSAMDPESSQAVARVASRISRHLSVRSMDMKQNSKDLDKSAVLTDINSTSDFNTSGVIPPAEPLSAPPSKDDRDHEGKDQGKQPAEAEAQAGGVSALSKKFAEQPDDVKPRKPAAEDKRGANTIFQRVESGKVIDA